MRLGRPLPRPRSARRPGFGGADERACPSQGPRCPEHQAIGKSYDPVVYAVGREKIREYARAVGETSPLHLDVEAARAAGYADVVAPPMFAVVYSAPAVGPAIFDPEIETQLRDDGPRRPGVRVGAARCGRR